MSMFPKQHIKTLAMLPAACFACQCLSFSNLNSSVILCAANIVILTMKSFVKLLFVIPVFLFFAFVATQSHADNTSPVNAREFASNLRGFYFQQDFEGGAIEGQKLAPKFADSNEVKAWYILNLARNENNKDAITLAEEMVQKAPEDVWSWFALAGAMNWDKEKRDDALDVSETAYRKAPDNSDIIWLRAEVLRRQELYFDALSFIDANSAKVNNAELKVSKALVLLEQGDNNNDQAKIKTAFDVFLEARTLDPNCVNAFYVPATFLFSQKKYNDAYLLLKSAAKLAPSSLKIHTLYWQSISGSALPSVQSKIQEFETDVNVFLSARKPNAKTLDAIALQYGNFNVKARKIEIEDRILREFNNSAPAEKIMAQRYREFASSNRAKFNDVRVREQYLQLLRDFTKRQQHFSRQLLSEAYQLLFVELKDDKNLSDKELFDIVKGMAYNDENNLSLSFIKGTQALINRNAYLKETEQIVRYGFSVAKKRAELNRDFYKSKDDYADFLNDTLSDLQDTLGWILFKQNRFEEAEKELLKAYEMDKNDAQVAFHLSQLYEATNRFDKAEQFYIKGLGADTDGVNPNEEAVKAYYARRNGSLNGYDAYQIKLMESVLEARKARVLTEKISNREQAKPFMLSSLNGRDVSLTSLRGKVVVINFWGVWCNYCVKEMPDLQRLVNKYAKDSQVEILTINNDGNNSMVEQFMRDKKYNFTVLLENGYNNRVGIRSYPTTWFIDKQGRIAYIKRNYSKELLEEFSFRIEDLKAEK